VRQEPEPGRRVDSGSSINLWVSTGPTSPDAKPAAKSEESRPSKAKHTGKVHVTVPAEPLISQVRIVVRDDQGEHTVYDQTHYAGDVVDQTVSGLGETQVEVFINDQSVQKRTL
jgi:beta-lactam-binding protein with PASTA domain